MVYTPRITGKYTPRGFKYVGTTTRQQIKYSPSALRAPGECHAH